MDLTFETLLGKVILAAWGLLKVSIKHLFKEQFLTKKREVADKHDFM